MSVIALDYCICGKLDGSKSGIGIIAASSNRSLDDSDIKQIIGCFGSSSSSRELFALLNYPERATVAYVYAFHNDGYQDQSGRESLLEFHIACLKHEDIPDGDDYCSMARFVYNFLQKNHLSSASFSTGIGMTMQSQTRIKPLTMQYEIRSARKIDDYRRLNFADLADVGNATMIGYPEATSQQCEQSVPEFLNILDHLRVTRQEFNRRLNLTSLFPDDGAGRKKISEWNFIYATTYMPDETTFRGFPKTSAANGIVPIREDDNFNVPCFKETKDKFGEDLFNKVATENTKHRRSEPTSITNPQTCRLPTSRNFFKEIVSADYHDKSELRPIIKWIESSEWLLNSDQRGKFIDILQENRDFAQEIKTNSRRSYNDQNSYDVGQKLKLIDSGFRLETVSMNPSVVM